MTAEANGRSLISGTLAFLIIAYSP